MKLKEVLVTFKRIFVKRKYKDILFRYVFREKKEILQLYNAINQTSYTNEDDLIITTMEDVIYVGMKNDLSFIIANEMNLYEHESSFNENMPLRGFLYFAKMYTSYIETHHLNRFQKKRIPLPFPRFIVFYNGEKDMPEVLELRLSDSFETRDEEPAIECIARFININYGHNQQLLSSCKRLHDYSYFVACVRQNVKRGMRQNEAVSQAIDECIEKRILEDVLLKHRAEVTDMFFSRRDKKMYEEALRIDAREEALEEAREEARAEIAREYKELIEKCNVYQEKCNVYQEKCSEYQEKCSEYQERCDELETRVNQEKVRAVEMEMENAKLLEEIAKLKEGK